MAYSREQQDAELDRLAARLVAEHEAMQASQASDYCHSRNITGEPSEKNRNYRVAPNSWTNHIYRDARGNLTSRRTRIVGGDVTVTKDGKTTVVPSDSFRKEKIHTKQRKHREAVVRDTRPEVVRYNVGIIGNIE